MEDSDSKLIAVCTPNLGQISAACTRAIMQAQSACQAQNRPWSFIHADVETVIVGKARSLLTRLALDVGADVVFFVDEDVVIPPHAVVALMDRNLPIVGGFYIARKMPYLPQIYTTEDTEGQRVPYDFLTTPRQVYWPVLDYPTEPVLLEVDAIGAGCLMVQREVFEKMEASHRVQDGMLQEALALIDDFGVPPDLRAALHEHARVMDPWFEFLTDEGEDMYFCRKARRAGYRIYVDLSVKCQHLGVMPLEEGHFLFVKPSLQRLEYVPEGDTEVRT